MVERTQSYMYRVVFNTGQPGAPDQKATFYDALAALEYARTKAQYGNLVTIHVFCYDDANWVA